MAEELEILPANETKDASGDGVEILGNNKDQF